MIKSWKSFNERFDDTSNEDSLHELKNVKVICSYDEVPLMLNFLEEYDYHLFNNFPIENIIDDDDLQNGLIVYFEGSYMITYDPMPTLDLLQPQDVDGPNDAIQTTKHIHYQNY